MGSDYNHYEWLGVQPNSSLTEIREAFSHRAKQCHPSKHNDNADQLTTYQTLTDAFSTLINADSRRAYDLSIGLDSQEHQLDPWARCLSNPLVNVQQNTYCCTVIIEHQLYQHFRQACESEYSDTPPIDRGANGTQIKTSYHSPGDPTDLYGAVSLTFYDTTLTLHVQGISAFLWVAEYLPVLYERADKTMIDSMSEDLEESLHIVNDEGEQHNEHSTPQAAPPESNTTQGKKGPGRPSKRNNKKKEMCSSSTCNGKQGAQLRCIICMRWHHNHCVKEATDYEGSWSCLQCRSLPNVVAQLQAQLVDISKALLCRVNSDAPSDVLKENEELKSRNHLLESQISNHAQKVKHLEIVIANQNKMIQSLTFNESSNTSTSNVPSSAPTNSHRRDTSTSPSSRHHSKNPGSSDSARNSWIPAEGVDTRNKFDLLSDESDSNPASETDDKSDSPISSESASTEKDKIRSNERIDLSIISASLGRGAAELLNKDPSYDAYGYVYPGESAKQVNGRIKNIPASEITAVLVGSIDAEMKNLDDCKEEMRKVVDNVSRKRKGKTVIMCEIPMRYRKKYLNTKIDQVNKYLHELSSNYPNVHMLEHDNHPKDFWDGHHFSDQGMGKFCLNIRSKLRELNLSS